MNIYIKALGFQYLDSAKEKEMLDQAINESVDKGLFIRHEELNRGVVILRISKSTGLYIYGRFDENKFVYEYYFPFVMGRKITKNDELTIERHLDKESFAVVCDEQRTGVTLIFYLQNVMDYLEYIYKAKEFESLHFNLDEKNEISQYPIKKKRVSLSALAISGIIMLPTIRNKTMSNRERASEVNRQKLIQAAKKGDEEAIENLTIEDIDKYTEISHRIVNEDLFTIVDSTFMPCGVECDQYSVVGDILELEIEENVYTGEKIYIMVLDCNNLIITLCINKLALMGEPKVGRRFKGQIWLQGSVKFDD